MCGRDSLRDGGLFRDDKWERGGSSGHFHRVCSPSFFSFLMSKSIGLPYVQHVSRVRSDIGFLHLPSTEIEIALTEELN